MWVTLRREWLSGILVFVLVVFLVAFLATMVRGAAQQVVGHLLGLSEKNEILSFLGIAMGGVLVALQAVASYRRSKAMEDTAGAQAAAASSQAQANANTERGQRQERLKNAIEHLGSKSDSVRLGGAYELFHLASDSEDLRQTALDILCAHIRGTTRTVGYQQEHASEPAEEVQSLLTQLFVREHHVFKGLRANLEGSFLNGARLPGVRLAQASLREVQLRNANLWGAELQGADMESACLQDATMFGAQLQGAVLTSANLQGAKLRDAGLQGGHLMHAQLQNAHLVEAKLQGADIRNAGLHGADLSGAKLQGARMNFAKLQGASLAGASFHGVDSKSAADPREPVTQIRNRTGRESDLSTVAFSGGVTETDVQALTTDMSDGWADQLRARLEEHVGKPLSRKPPNGVITGAYSATEAENWIAEYEQAVAASRERECDRGGR